MMFLAFQRESTSINGRCVRASRFEHRSLLPVSAACVVANGFREILSELLAAPVRVRLFEPLLPDRMGWDAVVREARIHLVRGARADAALVLRAADALRLAGAAFGEADCRGRALSALEESALERIVEALGAQLAAVCGACAEPPRRLEGLAGFSTYIEVQIEEPLRACIGVALSREPLDQSPPVLTLRDMRSIDVEVAVRLGEARLEAGELAGLELGSFLPLGPAAAPAGIAYLAGRALGHGECGVVGGRYALSVGTLIGEGSNEPSL